MGHDLQVHYHRPARRSLAEARRQLDENPRLTELAGELREYESTMGWIPVPATALDGNRDVVVYRPGPRWGVFLRYDANESGCHALIELCRCVGRCIGASRMILAGDQGVFSGLLFNEHGGDHDSRDLLERERRAEDLRLLDLADMRRRSSDENPPYFDLFYAESLEPRVAALR